MCYPLKIKTIIIIIIIYPSLVLVLPRKTCPFITERLLMGGKESNKQTNINPSLVLVLPRKTRPCITERLLMGGKESTHQTNKKVS